jgi:hypothetical protein
VSIPFLPGILDISQDLKNKLQVEQSKEEFEDTKVVIRILISKKNRQHNGQKKKYKRTNNDLQNIHIKLKIE